MIMYKTAINIAWPLLFQLSLQKDVYDFPSILVAHCKSSMLCTL